MKIRGFVHRYRRTAAMAAASGLVVLVASTSALTGAGAQPGSIGAAGSRHIAAQQAFANGTAKATALVAKIAPGVGSLELATGSGIAVSEIKNDLAQAQAQALDLGLIGTTLTAESCDGGEGTLTPDQLPAPIRVDNREGSAEATEDEVPAAGTTLGGGRMQVMADDQPLARAIATSSVIEAGPVISINGGRADTTTEIIDGKARQAHAFSQASINIAGIIELRGMRWDAIHRTGADPKAEGTFEVAGASAAGLPLPIEDLGTLQDAINTVLAPSGISILLPKIERFEEPADLIRVTPLTLILKDSPAGHTVLGPVLDLTRAQREDLFNQLAAAYCSAAGALLVGDIAVWVASGTGFLAVEVGGAEAITGEFTSTNPFTDPPTVVTPPPAITPTPTPGSPGSPGTPAAPGSPTSPSTPTTPVADVGPLEEFCESVHPFKWPSCSEGAALPLGLIGLGATAGVAALDWRHQRKRLAGATAPAGPAPATA